MAAGRLTPFLLFCSLFGLSQSGKYDAVYEATVAGTSCKQSQYSSSPSMECDYRVGKSLHFNIAGIGDEDAVVMFLKSDFEHGDYYAKVGGKHGCVIVQATKPQLNFAFVSPRTGKVYRNWLDCGVAGLDANTAAALRQRWEAERREAIRQMEKAHRQMEEIERKWAEKPPSEQPK